MTHAELVTVAVRWLKHTQRCAVVFREHYVFNEIPDALGRFRDACLDQRTGLPQAGINCAAFRNEGTARSSDLVHQADAIADCLWPDCRHYTYVDAARVQSRNPGYCFLVAGWQRCGHTKSGLMILERPVILSLEGAARE